MFDRDGNGVITTKELGTVMVALGQRPSLQEIEALIQGIDTNRKYTGIYNSIIQYIYYTL